MVHVGLIVDMLCMAQTPIYRQAKGLAVTEEVGGAKEVFQSGWGPTNGNRACIEGTNEDLTSFGGPLLFHDVSATTSG